MIYSYCIPIDDGAAPNPYWGICTLVICKPAIRRKAIVGDWVAGVGSRNVDGKDYSGKLVYAMKITNKMTMAEYDGFTQKMYPNKIPNWRLNQNVHIVGDSIYDFSQSPPKIRMSVHNEYNRETDLSGLNALISNHFYYFGDKAVDIPKELLGIVKQGQGHKSLMNKDLTPHFVEWIEKNFEKNKIYGQPQITILETDNINKCSAKRIACSVEDEILNGNSV